jgi:hypothetical protein
VKNNKIYLYYHACNITSIGPVTLLPMREFETYEKRMEINEIIFIRTKILWNASVWLPYIWRTSSVFSVCLEYAYRIKDIRPNTHKCLAVCHRMRPCLKRIQPMLTRTPSVCRRIYRRMSDIFHTLAYASTIRNSVTGPYARKLGGNICDLLISRCNQLPRSILTRNTS